jgi:hypothetical protein
MGMGENITSPLTASSAERLGAKGIEDRGGHCLTCGAQFVELTGQRVAGRGGGVLRAASCSGTMRLNHAS